MMRNLNLNFVANSQNMGEESGWVGDVYGCPIEEVFPTYK